MALFYVPLAMEKKILISSVGIVKRIFLWDFKRKSHGLNQITVKNAEGDSDTTATLIVQNHLDYVPKVSVIIPVYNVKKYLRECLDSVAHQTLKEIEVICVDDGSTDSSLKILEEYAAKDNRITILSQNNYHGGVARNAGLMVAKGEFVHFCDSDDMYPNDQVLELLYTTAVKNKVLVCGGSRKQLKNGKIIEDSKFSFEKKGLIDFYDYQFIYGYQRFIFNREFLKSHQILFPKRKRFQDPPFFIKAMHQAGSFYAIKEPTYVYRIVDKPRNYFDKVVPDIAKGIKDVLDYAKQNNLEKIYNDLYARIHTKFMKEKLSKKSNSGESYLQWIGPKSVFDKQMENIDEIFNKNVLISSFLGRDYVRFLSPNSENIEEYNAKTKKPDFVFVHGSGTWSPQPETIEYAIENNIPLIKMEDGFLRSADTWCNHTVDKKYTIGISYSFTNDVFYYDATRSSYMERQINDPDFHLTPEQIKRTRKIIKTIIDNHLTKYNHQPIFEPKIGRDGVPKILVIDQSYGDFSIKQGLANDDTFTEMLASAIKENPGADIIIKTHPDAIAPGTQRPLGYYSTLQEHDNVYILREPINPISLIKYVDKVYVCTTQFGFEALMCGKEVHTFGMPFYAGWGLTIDKLKNPRRSAKRTLEEIFYIAYIKNTRYVDPIAQKPCSIERAMEYLIDLRKEYQGILHPKISVIIPVYNTEKYLSQCLDSVLNQTLKDFEIICVNDGSTDNSLDELKKYEESDPRIRLIDQKNQGLSCSRNNAMQIARGKYVVFLDSDDYLDKKALEKIYEKMEANHLDMLSYGGMNFDDLTQEQKLNNYWEFKYLPQDFNYDQFSYKDADSFLIDMAVSSCLTSYRLNFLKECDITFPDHLFFEDNLFFCKSILNSKSCGLLKERLYFRRIHGMSITQNRKKYFPDYLKIADMLLDYVKEKEEGLYEQYKKFYLQHTINFYSMCSSKDKRKHLSEFKKFLKKHYQESSMPSHSQGKIKFYLFFPFSCIIKHFCEHQLVSDLSNGKIKPSKIFSITKTPYKKVYHFLGLKWVSRNRFAELRDLICLNRNALNSFQKDMVDFTREEVKKQSQELKIVREEMKKQCQELNFANLLHDSILNSKWLQDKSFSLYDWAANYSFIYTLFKILDNMKPMSILEMGLGQTTKLTTQYVAHENTSAQLDVIEDNQNWIDVYQPQLPSHKNIHISKCDLEYFDLGNVSNCKYSDLSRVTGQKKYNLIIVDGPWGGKQFLPRSNVIDLIKTNLADDFVIIFDDAGRPGEQNTIEKTKEQLQQLGIEFVENKRVGSRTQILLISKSMDYIKYL